MHHKYFLKDKLIAVGVLDVLDNCISSVYFFYDPEYKNLNLGKFSALNEINLVLDYNKKNQHILYYYMGYYIHSCQKMKYKAEYKPSQLLDPECFEYVDYEKCLLSLKKGEQEANTGYTTFIQKEKDEPIKDLNRFKIVFKKAQIIPLQEFIDLTNSDYPELVEILKTYCSLVGKECTNIYINL